MSFASTKFGEFELNAQKHALTRDGVVIKLAPQPFRVLMLLIERAGSLVTREELRQTIWGDDTIVDFEHGLNTCIRHIRLALGDDADIPRYIETVPRLGYRFKAEVEKVQKAVSRVVWWRTAAAGAVIIGGVVGLLMVFGSVMRGASHSSIRPELNELYLRGQFALEDTNEGGARAALELFEKVLAADPKYAPAHAAVAEVYLQKPSSIPAVPPEVAVARGRHAVEQALALDESLPEAHVAAAHLQMTLHDWAAAGREYHRAIDLAPERSTVRQQYAMWLSYEGRLDDAIKEARLGESLDPLSTRARSTVAEVLRNGRRFDDAIVQAQRVLELNPNFGPAHFILGHCYLAQGRFDAAIDEYRRSGIAGGNLGHAYALAGRTSEARHLLEALEERYASTRRGPGDIAQVYIGLGDYDRAFKWLSRAVEDGSVWTLKVAVVWDSLRSDPRFDQLLRKSGLRE